MNKEFEKVVEELEMEMKASSGYSAERVSAFSRAIEIVKQEAEQYNVMIDGEYCFQSCGCTEMCGKCSRIANGDTDYYESICAFSEQYNNGWIPCSERLPEDDKNEYMVQKTNGFIDILGFTKDAYKLNRYDFAEYRGKKKQLFYDYDPDYGYIECECEVWQPLPKPFQPK